MVAEAPARRTHKKAACTAMASAMSMDWIKPGTGPCAKVRFGSIVVTAQAAKALVGVLGEEQLAICENKGMVAPNLQIQELLPTVR